MKSFKFKFLTITLILLALVACLSVAGVVFNVLGIINLLKVAIIKPINVIGKILMLLLSVFLLILCVSIIFGSKYQVKKDKVLLYLGLFKSKYNIDEIVEFVHFKKSNKLVMYFKNAEYTVISVSPVFYEQFILSVRENKREIYYATKTDGEDTPN